MQARKRIVNAEIISNEPIVKGHFVVLLKAPEIASCSKPGQFVTVKVQQGTTDPLLRIPLSLYRIEPDKVSLLYKVAGSGTQLLSTKKVGEFVSLLGPLGNGFDIDIFKGADNDEAILVGGGCGVAPLYGLAEALIKKGIKTTVFIGARLKGQVLCESEFMHLNTTVYVSTEDGSAGYKGYVADLLEQHIQTLTHPLKICLYGSGPNIVLKLLAKIANQLDIPAQLSFESYMACGIGACYGCTVNTRTGYKLCCKDGPVFDAKIMETE